MTRATVITDASFYSGSGRRKSTSPGAVGGWAAWIRIDGRPDAIKGYGVIKSCSDSNVAEMYAALNGIWLAANSGAKEILVRTDNSTVIGLIHGKVKAAWLVKLWKTALEDADLLHIKLQGRHVKGHGEIIDPASYVNDWCDRHAKKAMMAARSGKKCLKLIS